MYSVKPLASRSSPAFLSSPLEATDGRPIWSNQNSMAKAGADNKPYNRYVACVQDVRNTINRSRMKKALTAMEIRWVRLRMEVLRAACCLAAFWIKRISYLVIQYSIGDTYLSHHCTRTGQCNRRNGGEFVRDKIVAGRQLFDRADQ